MAFKMDPQAPLVMFSKIFGSDSKEAKIAKALVNEGVTFTNAMYSIQATVKGKPYSHTCSKSITSLMNGMGDYATLKMERTKISGWLMVLCGKAGVSAWDPDAAQPAGAPPTYHTYHAETPQQPAEAPVAQYGLWLVGVKPGVEKLAVIKAIRTVLSWDLKSTVGAVNATDEGLAILLGKGTQAGLWFQAQKLSEAGAIVHSLPESGKIVGEKVLVASLGVNVPGADAIKNVPIPDAVKVSVPAGKPVDGVVSLRDAQAIGQKVNGTSPGSIYYCIAYNPRIKMAARIYPSGSISIRVEWTQMTKEETKRLEEAGITLKEAKKYGSIHFNAEDVPYGRIIGAFLVGVGLDFDEQVKNAGQLIVSKEGQ